MHKASYQHFTISLICLISLCFLGVSQLQAQDKAVIYGKVTGDRSKPLEQAIVSVIYFKPLGVATDANGKYELSIPANESLQVIYSFLGFKKDTVNLRLAPGERREINIKLKEIILDRNVVEIRDNYFRTSTIKPLDPKLASKIATPGDGITSLLRTMPGVFTRDEMSSQYSVRGGNYDENLVYVNDVEIYRPFLVRAGQQEGLSFANPDMVSALKFSAGGFDAKYGDKMSSVLDINYKRPVKFAGSAAASLLGANLHLEGAVGGTRLSYMIGARQRTTQYLLNSLDVSGQYRPSFADVQAFLSYMITTDWSIEFLGNYALNNYRVIPESRTTDFGTINEALRLQVFFQGQEQNRFETLMGAITSTYKPNKELTLKFITSAFNSRESERFDVEGFYRIDELERDLGSDNFGNSAFTRGIGSYLQFARNRLDYQVVNVEHKGYLDKQKHFIQWGARAQTELINDRLNEWRMVDSADFSLPILPLDEILLQDVVKATANFRSFRYQGYIQDNIEWYNKDTVKFTFTYGLRANHWTLNGQTLLSPRLSLSFQPKWEKDVLFRISAGHYAQPPFYRELRAFDGALNKNLKAQESYHIIAGMDYDFKAWDRPFNFYGEVYYKYLTNLVPYEIDNVRIRYYAENSAVGYAKGIDMRVNGEFVKGVQSWASLSLMKTEEDILNDFYYEYFNTDGERIVPGFTFNQEVADSVRYEPGFIPRPTDQRFNFSLFFQDYLPNNPTLSMQITLIFGSRLPIGPPDFERYKDTLRIPSYRRVDLGFSKMLISKDKKLVKSKFLKTFNEMWLSLEVFNLFGTNNTISYLWIKDVTNRTYAVPNYLTNRLLNLRLQANF
jgi:hypothetical protein